MNPETWNRRYYFVRLIIAIILLAGIIIWLLSHVKLVVVLLSISILLAYVLHPAVSFFCNPIILSLPEKIKIAGKEMKVARKKISWTIRKRGFSRIVSISIVFIFAFLFLMIFFSYLIPTVNEEFQKFTSNFPKLESNFKTSIVNYYQKIEDRIPEKARAYLDPANLIDRITDATQEFIKIAAQQTLSLATRFLSGVAAALIIPLLTFLILLDVEKYREGFRVLIPAEKQPEIMALMTEIDLMLGRYVRGQLIVCFVIGVSITVVLLLWGIDYAVLIGVFSGVIDIIPYVGVIISLIPAVILALTNKGILIAILVLITLEAVHWLEGHIIVPSVVGHSVGLPPLVIIIALIIGAELLGILGMLLAIPVAAIIRVVVNFYLRRLAERRSCA